MKKNRMFMLATLLAIAGLFMGWQSPAVTAREPKILEFDTMVGLPEAFTGAQNPIRGVNGGGLPWTLTSASGELKTSGRLEIEVRGLVLAASGNNPIPSFRAIVSCLTSDGDVHNVMTDAFPATTGLASDGGGNAKIEADLLLPQPCIAPIIFVTSPGGAWFAATGN